MIESALFLLGRLLYGGFFLYMSTNHFFKTSALAQYAASKKVLLPKISVIFSGLLIFFGGLGILFGLYIKVAIVLLLLFLLIVSFKMHDFWAFQDSMQKEMQKINFLKNMALAGAALMFLKISQPWI